jgi:hypothetical protein
MRTKESRLTMDGSEYCWSIHREPQWCTDDGWKGLAVAVAAVDAEGRQLIIELPFRRASHRSTPHRQRPAVSIAELERHIRGAIADGWSPLSRGKDYVYEPSIDV